MKHIFKVFILATCLLGMQHRASANILDKIKYYFSRDTASIDFPEITGHHTVGTTKSSTRETIFDKVVSIPKELILDVPLLPPICDEIKDLKKGYAEIENGKLYYEEEGHGIPLILLNPGPGGTHQMFHPYFSRIKDVARVIYYDPRGTGKSSRDETGRTYTIKQAVEDVESLRKALKIDAWVVVGWSFGGFLAQCYALTYPEHVKGLVLVAAGDGLKNVEMKEGREEKFKSKAEREAIKKIYAAEDEGTLNIVQTMYNKDLAGAFRSR